MHKYLRAIGFSKFRSRREVENLLLLAERNADKVSSVKISDGECCRQSYTALGNKISISSCGIVDENNDYYREFYFPYVKPEQVSTQVDCEIQRHSDKESYSGMCEEYKLGVSLIFYLQNVCDYLSEKAYINREVRAKGAVLSGLSVDGCILLPMKQKKAKTLNTVDSDKKDRKQLIAEARDGDEGAMESLTMEDIDLYSSITRRIQNEDILSIVTTYFMPYGIESDQYSVLGDIIEFTEEKNIITNEKIYCIKVSCNDIIFSVCINKNDLIGEPMVGRRFKGNIWMQGSICL